MNSEVTAQSVLNDKAIGFESEKGVIEGIIGVVSEFVALARISAML